MQQSKSLSIFFYFLSLPITSGTLIVWNEPVEGNDDGRDYALSFPESSGCKEVWYVTLHRQYKMNPLIHDIGTL